MYLQTSKFLIICTVCGAGIVILRSNRKALMAKVCYFTGRKTVSGNNRSHAMNQTKRAVKPNLQKVTVLIDGKPKSLSSFAP